MTALNNNSSLGNRIKAQRIYMGMTQEQLAEAMCVPKSTISAYENDKIDIKSSVIRELSRILKTSPNYFLGYSLEMNQTIEGIISILLNIHDDRLMDILYTQIKAVSDL